jgi:hypothetical protein
MTKEGPSYRQQPPHRQCAGGREGGTTPRTSHLPGIWQKQGGAQDPMLPVAPANFPEVPSLKALFPVQGTSGRT